MLEQMTGINKDKVSKILLRDLKKKKVCAHLVPHFLTPDQKHQHAAISVEFGKMIDDARNVLKRIVTVNESWCSMYHPATKSQSATWLSPKKQKAQKVGIILSDGINKYFLSFLCGFYSLSLGT
jgi:hypothetical protein